MILPADHLLDLAEWEALPEDNSRHYELQDGVLITAPKPGSLHQVMLCHLMLALKPQLLRPWDLLHQVEVVTQPAFPACVRVPDVVVFSEDVVNFNAPRLSADQVLVAVECISPGSRLTDTVVKPVEYGRAGIPYYWVFDLEPEVSLTAYCLAGGRYRQAPAVTGLFSTVEPFPLEIDLATLLNGPRAVGRSVER